MGGIVQLVVYFHLTLKCIVQAYWVQWQSISDLN